VKRFSHRRAADAGVLAFAVATVALLSVFLRQRGSHDSKHVGDPHAKTGTR
jgi:hypothetical protein